MNNYSFFLFSSLVKDDLMVAHNISIPYDQLFEIVEVHFAVFKANDDLFNISEYEAMEKYIQNTGSLLADLLSEYTLWNDTKPHSNAIINTQGIKAILTEGI